MLHRMRFLPIGLAVVLLAGCDLLDLDINTDPDAATEVPGDLLMPNVLASVGSTRAIEIMPAGAAFVNIITANGSAGVFIDPERYSIDGFTTDNTWTTVYTDGLKNLKLMKDQALAADPVRANVAAQAEIFSAYLFIMATSIWEQVPFTEALDGDAYPTPVFDDQETVLHGVVDMLDTAVGRIDESGLPGVEDGDLLYGGDMSRWQRFANSLKLRALMMIRNKDESVDDDIADVLNEPLIRANMQEAAIPFFNTTNNENNVWKLNNLYGGFTNAGNGNGFWFAGNTLVELMKDLGDPRISTYFELATDFDTGEEVANEYFGQFAGVSQYNDGITSTVSQNIIREDWPNRILPAAEVWLYEAEYYAEQGNLASAHSSYMSGVQAGLDYFDAKPGQIAPGDKNDYLASLPQSFGTQQQALEAIWAQEYIEVFDRSPENWVHWKRTKYPALEPAFQAVLGDIIRRFPMSSRESSANPNTPTGIPGDQPMWFEK